MTNCCECEYGFNNRCKTIRGNQSCFNCDNFNTDTLECRCTEVEDDSNCPHYKEYCGGERVNY